MSIVGWDTETHLISDDDPIPRIIVHSFSPEGFPPILVPGWVEGERALERFLFSALSGEIVLVAHNAAFDVTCAMRTYPRLTPLLFRVLDANGILCTQRLVELDSLATVGFVPQLKQTSLAACVKKLFGESLDKGADTYRLRYAELEGVPLTNWPEEAREYALGDAVFCRRIAQKVPWSKDVFNQTRYSVAFRCMESWGMRVDADMLAGEKDRLTLELEKERAEALNYGLVRPDGTKNTAELQALVETHFLARGGEPPRTKTGAVKTDRVTLGNLPEDHPVWAVDRIKRAEKLLGYLDKYQDAGASGRPVHPRVNVLVNTGRTSMAEPNLQQLPRAGSLRECFVARPGHVFVNPDLDTAELRSLGQVCLDTVGFSRLAELFQRDPMADPHMEFAKAMLPAGASPNDIEAARQRAKAANFGFPGGMGVDTFITNQRAQGAEFTPDEAAALKASYLQQWTEMRPYFRYVSTICDTTKAITLPVSGRVRANVTFCNGANTGFQGRTADVAKLWAYLVVRESLTESSSPLYGARLVNFIHDEIIVEASENVAHEAAKRTEELAEIAGAFHLPNVPTRSSAALMRRWYKKAKPVYGPDGRLVPWQPN